MGEPDPIEKTAAWPEILRLKDSLSLRELGQRFRASPGAISAAFKRTGTVRVPPQGPSSHDGGDDELPPEPGEAPAARPAAKAAPRAPRQVPSASWEGGRSQDTDTGGDLPGGGERDDVLPEVAAALSRIRAGSKDALIAQHASALGQVPDAEVARRAGVSVRTIASFRARHQIPGYRGPRRGAGGGEGDEYDDDAVDITPVPPGERQRAWRVTWRRPDGTPDEGVLLAHDLVAAAAAAERTVHGDVTGIQFVGLLIGG